jgi:hypothetical protein
MDLDMNKVPHSVVVEVQDVIMKSSRPNEFEWGDVLLVCMNVVEAIAKKNPEMHGADKRDKAKQLIPLVIEQARQVGYVSLEQALTLENYAQISVDVVDGLINAFHFIKEHPTFIQFKDKVTTHCCAPKVPRRKK